MSRWAVLWILLLAALGFLLWGPFGVLVGVFFGWLIASAADRRQTTQADSSNELQRKLETRVDDLERQLAALRLHLGLSSGQAAAAEHAPSPAAPPGNAPESARSAVPAGLDEDKDQVRATGDDPDRLPPVRQQHDAASATPAGPALWPRRVWQLISGGNPVVRIGVVVLFIGVAFLVRYAAERDLVPIELRLTGVAAAAVAALLLGWRLRGRPGAYGLVLQGGAVAVLYLTVFSAARLYDLMPLSLAFALMASLVALSALLALLQNSRWFALFSVSGGFLAPVLTSTGQGSHVALFGYYALLNAGILAIAWFRAWRELNLAGFLFTFIIGSLWGYRYYQPTHFSTTEPFLILFFLFFTAIAVLFALRRSADEAPSAYLDGTLVFGVPLVAFGLQAGLVRETEFGLAYSALVLAGFYLVAAMLLWRRAANRLRLLTEGFWALALVFATLAVPLALDSRWTTAVWALEGAALVWLGVRQHRPLARLAGLLLQLGAAATVAITFRRYDEGMLFLNGSWLATAMVALGAMISAYWLSQSPAQLRAWEAKLAGPALVWGMLWWLGGAWADIEAHLPVQNQLDALILYWALLSLLAGRIACRLEWRALSLSSMTLAPLMAFLLALEFFGAQRAHAFEGWGAAVWPLAVLAGYQVLNQGEQRWPPHLASAWHALSLWVLTALLSWECAWLVGQVLGGGEAWRTIAWAVVPALTVLVLLRWGDRIRWPVSPFSAAYRVYGAGGLALYLYLWMLAASRYPGDMAALPYMVLLNPLDLSQLFALLTVGHWLMWRRRSSSGFPRKTAGIMAAAMGFAGFVWINAVLARAVHFWGGVDWRWLSFVDSVLYHTAVSILWSLLALGIMVMATRRALRVVWFVGAGLLAVVVIKLFIVDLSGIGTLARIVSFVSVGMLMLVIGYFSPLPPRDEVSQ